jgi:signal transduction histidine kinase
MAIVLGAVGGFVYVRSGSDLLDSVDAGLRSRAEILSAEVRAHGPTLADTGSALIERDEAFAQIADASGRIVQSSPVVAGKPLLDSSVVRDLGHPQLLDRRVPGIDNVTRVFAVPVQSSNGRSVVMVGSSLQDRSDELIQLASTLAVGGPIALILISLSGWALAGAALRPVERMRAEADEFSITNPRRRLPVPEGNDEIARLGATLNEMLDRIRASFERERSFVDRASHELRTPLAILKAELDLGLSRARSVDELETALRSAAGETDHLARLAEDLLVLSRLTEGRLPVHPEEVSLSGLLERSVGLYADRAEEARATIVVRASNEVVRVDPVRVRQALENLLDNALRHAGSGLTIEVLGERVEGSVRISVHDSGAGFPPALVDRVLQPFVRGRGGEGAGLGLAIVGAVAQAHGGSVLAGNDPRGGARVTLVIPDADAPSPSPSMAH